MSLDLWPPPFTIRSSAKSKRILLKITPHKGLEVVVPKNTSQKKAIEFLYLQKVWVQNNLHLCRTNIESRIFPTTIQLRAINQMWNIHYTETIASRFVIDCDYSTYNLYVPGDNENKTKCLNLIKNWLKATAGKYLNEWLEEYSHQYRLPFHSLSIRDQKSLWGSCSKMKNISLNYKLLFLPKELVRYVIVHELVHTIHFNHSRMFWTTLGRFIPNYISLRSQLKTMDRELPNWLYY